MKGEKFTMKGKYDWFKFTKDKKKDQGVIGELYEENRAHVKDPKIDDKFTLKLSKLKIYS